MNLELSENTVNFIGSSHILFLVAVFIYLSKLLIESLINFQRKIGNDSKAIMKSIIKAKAVIIDVFQFFFIFGALLALYGLWLAPKV